MHRGDWLFFLSESASVNCRYPQNGQTFHVSKYVESTKGNGVGVDNIFYDYLTRFDMLAPYFGDGLPTLDCCVFEVG